MKKSRFAKKMMALILAVVTAVTLMPVNGFMSKVSADETENVKPDYLTFTAKEAGSTITFAWKTGSDVMCSTEIPLSAERRAALHCGQGGHQRVEDLRRGNVL